MQIQGLLESVIGKNEAVEPMAKASVSVWLDQADAWLLP